MVHWELRELVFSSVSRAVKLTEAGVLDEPQRTPLGDFTAPAALILGLISQPAASARDLTYDRSACGIFLAVPGVSFYVLFPKLLKPFGTTNSEIIPGLSSAATLRWTNPRFWLPAHPHTAIGGGSWHGDERYKP